MHNGSEGMTELKENVKTKKRRASEKILMKLASGRENSTKDQRIVPGINIDVLLWLLYVM